MASFEYGFAFYKAFLLFKMHKIFIIGPFSSKSLIIRFQKHPYSPESLKILFLSSLSHHLYLFIFIYPCHL